MAMHSADGATNMLNNNVYELCVMNGLVHARPVIARALRRVSSAPSILMRAYELTLILRNIPSNVKEEQMESVLRQQGFAGSYNYLFLPMRRNGSNLRYAVVNFIQEQHALRFAAVFDGHRFPGTTSMQRSSVILADVQGREANVAMKARHDRRAVH
eukprot:TRINITY_DN7148_c0_g4_i1.p1 TRINITY_DN7148_c0_g4~~TRINITY_DN7148_c0_g4_i1.p1  ORF type:complete len:175 (-),score=20.23 TRINITY_DN7148_c0_g4_i1:402-872(-)